MMSTFNETTEENLLSVMSVEVPANGKISTTVKLEDIRRHPDRPDREKRGSRKII